MMFTSLLRPRRLAWAAVAATSAVAGLAAPPTADAAFTVGRCDGSDVLGRGATFSRVAIDGFATAFKNTSSPRSCQGAAFTIGYNSGAAGAVTGSGAGRGAMGSGDSNAGGLGLSAGQRDNTVRFGGTDEGPSLGQQQNINAGLLGNSADDGKIHVIPVAAGAVAMIVNYPKWDADGEAANGDEAACPVPGSYAATVAGTPGLTRVQVPNWKLERAWSGAYSTWGEYLNDPDGAGERTGLGNDPARPADDDAAGQGRYDAGCTNRKLIRAVRQDSSGTTFAFKDFLNEAAKIEEPADTAASPLDGTASKTAWKASFLQGSTQNRSWPSTTADNDTVEATTPRPAGNTDYNTRYQGELGNNQGDIAAANFVCEASYVASSPKPVCRANNTGAGGVRDVVRANNGSIGFVDLATAVGGTGEFKKADSATDTTYYSPLAHRDSVSQYAEPTANANGFRTNTATGGANCANVPVQNLPVGTIPTTEFGWDATTMVFPTGGTPLYNDCSLTYVLAWDDNAPVYLSLSTANTYAQEQTRARAVKSFLEFAVSTAGQGTLVANDYSPLPNTVPGNAPAGTKSVLAAATAGVEAIDWDKAGIGNQNTGGGGTNTGGGGTDQTPVTPGPTNQQPVAPINVQPPSNLFTITSLRSQGRSSLLSSLQLPGAGQLVVTATGTYTAIKRKKGKAKAKSSATVAVGRATVNVTRAGALQVRLPISNAAKRALTRTKRMKVIVNFVFTPTGGTANTVTDELTLKGVSNTKKKKSKK